MHWLIYNNIQDGYYLATLLLWTSTPNDSTISLARLTSSAVGSCTSLSSYSNPMFSHLWIPIPWYGKNSTRSTLFRVEMNCPNFSKSAWSSVIPGIRTCLIQTGIFLSSKCFANLSAFSLPTPVSFLHFSLSATLD